MLDENLINMAKDMYPNGTRIRLLTIDDPYERLHTGDEGTVDYVDDYGTLHITWDNGENLSLMYSEYSFLKLN